MFRFECHRGGSLNASDITPHPRGFDSKPPVAFGTDFLVSR